MISGAIGLLRARGNRIDNITIDGIVEEVHNVTSTVSDYPVEFGANVSDNMVVNPIQVTIEGIVLNATSLIFGAQIRVPQVVRRIVTGSTETRSIEAYRRLIELMTDKKMFDLQTGLITYENMALVDITPTRNAQQSDGLFFTAKFQEIIIVQTEANNRSEEQYREGKPQDQNAPTRERGRQQARGVTSEESSGAINSVKGLRELAA